MSRAAFRLGEDRLTTAALVALASAPDPKVEVSAAARARLLGYRKRVDDILGDDKRVYGINTGFGFLADVQIDKSKLRELQVNLVRSHACGVGDPVPDEVVRGMLLLRAHTFLLGRSGVRGETLDLVLSFLRHDVLPIVPCQGSVGASGDLAPLAHLALGLMGEGDVRHRGETATAGTVLKALGLEALEPAAKEGLSLINGTQFMSVIAAFAVEEARAVARAADVATSLSLDAVRGTLAAFDVGVHEARPQVGQGVVAKNVRALFAGKDAVMESHKDCGRVQDPYSFRCAPQVHGASRDAIAYAADVVEIDLNSVTDNPLVLDDGRIVSGGNFHGQPVALAMDFLAIAAAEIGSISERRTEKITNPALSGLPAFAVKDSGLNSGFMIPHVVAASLVSENKVLCHPASVDSIPTSADKEDHVSMGPIAARKARDVVRNVRRVLAVELLAACQGLDLLAPLTPAPALAAAYKEIRTRSPAMFVDRSLHKDIELVATWIAADGPAKAAKTAGVTLE
jgi:histidine ammonia-lyase